ncbi:MAG: Ig-like domain-containing protein [Spirochaetes bacterium]|nr:Ig-like domain-containing protein [Spirochaetota bacterium]
MTKKWCFLSIFAAIFLALIACEIDTYNEGAQEGSEPPENAMFYAFDVLDGPRYATTSNVNNQTNVPISQWITVSFDCDINPSTLNSSTFKVVRASDNALVEGTISYANRVATFKPTFQFYQNGNKVEYKGLRQNTQYKVILDAANIKTPSGQPATITQTTFTFTTADLDYGIYFLGSNGEFEKFVPERPNSYYDPTKPVILYIHGWQNGTSQNNFGRENPFFFYAGYCGLLNAAQTWRSKGYNVAVVYWAQFADEGEVKDAEAKLWTANGPRQMRYRVQDGSYRNFSTTMNLTQLIYEVYRQAFSNYTGGHIRIVGHSLGNQLATTLAWTISNEYLAGRISGNLVPKRLVLLDPFWSKDGKSYLGGKWTGEVCRGYVRDLIMRHGIAIEQYKTSGLGGLVGDENLDMRKMTAFFRIWPDFISTTDQTAQHLYAYVWYVHSVNQAATGNYEAANGVGAAANDAQVRSLMNWNFSTNAPRTSPRFWYTSGSCTKTWTSSDDYFYKQDGVNTW